jgi:PAS domain S-box-containing protein
VAHVTPPSGPDATVSRRPDREDLRVLNNELLEKVGELERLNGEMRRSERAAEESLTLLETVLSAAPVGFGFIDREFRVQRMNETLATVNGKSVEEQLGRPVAELIPDLWPQTGPLYRRVIDSGDAIVNREVVREPGGPGGEARHWLSSFYPVRLREEVVGIGIVTVDVTERRLAEDFRAVVMETMVEGLFVTDADGRLMMMNSAGTRLLGFSEEELQGCLVEEVIHHQRADGSPLADEDSELRKVFAEGRTIRVADDAFTCKDGSILPVAYSAGPLLNGSALRGGVVVFRDVTDEKAHAERIKRELAGLAWVGRIRDALDEDRLVLYAQPIVSLNGGGHADELLVRMIGPRGEVIAPGNFLPVAEKYELIGEIDQWVLASGLLIAASGRRVHINLSADSISNTELLPLVERGLSETGATPDQVVFEITETALMTDIQAGERFTQGLADMGFDVALDDFGTGYGSLIYLQRLPITFLKIDIGFVRDLTSNTASQHVVKAIVNLAEGFGQKTVAEGVEDATTLQLLREYGVDFVQGFHTGRPAPLAPR